MKLRPPFARRPRDAAQLRDLDRHDVLLDPACVDADGLGIVGDGGGLERKTPKRRFSPRGTQRREARLWGPVEAVLVMRVVLQHAVTEAHRLPERAITDDTVIHEGVPALERLRGEPRR